MDIRRFFGKADGSGGGGGAAPSAAKTASSAGNGKQEEKDKPTKSPGKQKGTPAKKEKGKEKKEEEEPSRRKRAQEEDDEEEEEVKPKKRLNTKAKGKKAVPEKEVVTVADSDDSAREAKRPSRAAKEAGRKRRVIEVDEDDDNEEEFVPDEGEESAPEPDNSEGESEEEGSNRRKKRAKSAAKTPTPVKKKSPAQKKASPDEPAPKRCEISAEAFFSKSTVSKYFSHSQGQTGGAPAPAPAPAKAATPPAKKQPPPSPPVAATTDNEKDAEVDSTREETGGGSRALPWAKKSSEKAAKETPKKTPKSEPAAASADASGGSEKKGGGGGGGSGGGFRWGGERRGAIAKGSKEIPEGAPGCLEGKAFVITGVLESLDRDEAEDLIKTYGGKVTGSVSGKTAYLLIGVELEDGRKVEEGSKYKKAKERKTSIITEDDLLKLIGDSNKGKKAEASSTPAKKEEVKKQAKKEEVTTATTGSSSSKPSPAVVPVAVPPPVVVPSQSGKGKERASASVPVPRALVVGDGSHDLWADKYRPQDPKELVGGQEMVKKLSEWLRDWDKVHRFKTLKIPFQQGNYRGAKAVLMSGPPGIGKSTTASLVAESMGYSVYELNASDTRNKKSLEQELTAVIDNTALMASGTGFAGKPQTKRVIIMDEVDGMSASDRGGVQELMKLIKVSKVPIICICNDRQSQKVKSLANHCYDLRFKRPQKGAIANRMIDIAKKEGLQVERNAIEMIVESVGNDIRQVLNTMQMWKKTKKSMSYTNVKNSMSTIEKDKMLRVSPFEGTKMIFDGQANFYDRFNAYFTDYSLVPLLVQQNFLDVINKNGRASVTQRLEMAELASEAISDSDLVGTMIMSQQRWDLLPLQAMMNVKVGHHARGFLGFPAFSAWLGKNSSTGKRRRLVQELLTHMSGKISGGFQAVRMQYIPALRQHILNLLTSEDGGGASEVVEFLDEYGLSREDVIETMTELFLPPPDGKDPLKNLDSKVKAALTREYNKVVHKSQAVSRELYQVKVKGGKGRRKSGGGGGVEGVMVDEEGLPIESEAAAGEAEEEEGEGEGEEEELDLSAFQKKSRGGGKKDKVAGSSSGSSKKGQGRGSGKGKAKK